MGDGSYFLFSRSEWISVLLASVTSEWPSGAPRHAKVYDSESRNQAGIPHIAMRGLARSHHARPPTILYPASCNELICGTARMKDLPIKKPE